MKKKNSYRVYTVWTMIKKILGGMGAQDFGLLQRTTQGSQKNVSYLRGSFVFNKVKKTMRVMVMPSYVGGVGISSEYRDELTLIANRSDVTAKDIRPELDRIVDVWYRGRHSEYLFAEFIKDAQLFDHVEKTNSNEDRNNHVDYLLFLHDEEGEEVSPVMVDVKSSLPSNIPAQTLVYRRGDGVYIVDASETTITAFPNWANEVVQEILHLNKE